MTFEVPFDAVIGRYVLLFQPDGSAFIRSVLRHLRPGGLVVFHEPDWSCTRSSPAAPTYDRCCHWLEDAFRLSGTEIKVADRLHGVFARAGLTTPSMRMQTFIAGGKASDPFLDALCGLIAALSPAIMRFGIATGAEMGIETLAERMKSEVEANGSVIIGRSEIGIWART